MKFKDYLSQIIIEGRLPGFEAQKLMAPSATREKIRSFIPESGYKEASVLILLSEIDTGNLLPEIERNILASNILNSSNSSNSFIEKPNLYVCITERSKRLNSHSGQLSFPGGRIESYESALDAAIRETYEEIGITNDHYEVVGQLSKLYVPPSNSLITPYIAICNENLTKSIATNSFDQYIKLNKDEVESAFWVDMNYLVNPNNLLNKTTNLMNKETSIPFWDVSKFGNTDVPLWGATAIMLKELLHIYNDFLSNKIGN